MLVALRTLMASSFSDLLRYHVSTGRSACLRSAGEARAGNIDALAQIYIARAGGAVHGGFYEVFRRRGQGLMVRTG